MKFSMISVKFDQKNKKNLKNLNLDFLGFFKNLGFFRSHFPAMTVECIR